MKPVYVIRSRDQLPKAQPYEYIVYDTETTGLHPHTDTLLVLQIATPECIYVYDLTSMTITRDDIAPFFQSTMCIGMNLSFDWKWLYHHFGLEIGNNVDVMINERLLTSGLYVERDDQGNQFSLRAIAQRRLGLTLNKDIREEFITYSGGCLSDAAIQYAARDVDIPYQIYLQQIEEIRAKGLEQVFALECQLIPVTALMEYQGVCVDTAYLETLRPTFERYIQTCEQALQDIFIAHGVAQTIVFDDQYSCVDITSKPQVLAAFHRFGITVQSLNVKDLVKWDFQQRKQQSIPIDFSLLFQEKDDDIATAIDEYGGYEHPVLRAYAFVTGAHKLLSVGINGLQKKAKNGVIYPYFNQLGARSTGRYSSDFQQLPKNDKLARLGIRDASIRDAIRPRDGNVFIIADYSAIELNILADASGDERLIHELLDGDAHLVVARDVLGQFVPLGKAITSKNKKQFPYRLLRDFAKTLSYGVAYGVTGKSLAEQAITKLGALNVVITQQQGNAMVAHWKEQFPEAGYYLDQNSNAAITQGYVSTALGRKRFFDLSYILPDKWRTLAAKRQGSNAPIQGTSADMLKLAMVLLYERLDRAHAWIAFTVHDELVIESRAEYADVAQRIMKECMTDAARRFLPRLWVAVARELEPAISTKYDK